MKRAITTEVLNPLSEKLLSGQIQPGDTMEIDWKDGVLEIQKV